jgi:CheY-like chemotaxis protein
MSITDLRLDLSFKAKEPASPLACLGSHVLVVDDNLAIRKTFEIAMIQLKYAGRTSYASNGIEAVQIFKEHKDTISMIFMDVAMPEMDGLEAAREIRNLEIDGKHVPIVCIGSESIKGDLRWKDAGMDFAVGKDLSPRTMIETLPSLKREEGI